MIRRLNEGNLAGESHINVGIVSQSCQARGKAIMGYQIESRDMNLSMKINHRKNSRYKFL